MMKRLLHKALKGRQIVLPPLRGFVRDALFHPGAYTPVCDLTSLWDFSLTADFCLLTSFISELSEWFFREAGFLLGCAAKPKGYSGMVVQGLSSLLEQNMERQHRMKARRDCCTDKGFEGFCFNNIRRLNQQYYRLNSSNS